LTTRNQIEFTTRNQINQLNQICLIDIANPTFFECILKMLNMIKTAPEEYEYLVTPDLCDSYISNNISWPESLLRLKIYLINIRKSQHWRRNPIVQLRCIISKWPFSCRKFVSRQHLSKTPRLTCCLFRDGSVGDQPLISFIGWSTLHKLDCLTSSSANCRWFFCKLLQITC